MNLDLNLGSFVHPPQDDQPHNMSRRLPPVWRLAASGADDDERPPELVKGNENGEEGSSFFDCNICLDLASEPVVTCCGHLFCWPCIYRWLFVHSNAKQCPICKGEVTMKTITPIYGRVNRSHVTKVLDPNCLKIPSRPLANRIESWRQAFQRDSLNIPIIEMVRRLDNNRFHLSRDPMSSNPQEIPSTHLLNRIFTSRGIRERERESVSATSPDVTVNLPNDHIPNLTSAESFLDSYNRDHPDERNQEELLMVDRYLRLDVGDITQSEIMTAGRGSRRRREPSTSRVLDVDSGYSRPRRRRLHQL